MYGIPFPPTQRSHQPCPEAPWGNLEKYTENGQKLSPIFFGGLPKHWFTMHVVKHRNGGVPFIKINRWFTHLVLRALATPHVTKKVGNLSPNSKFGGHPKILRYTVTHPSSDSKMLKSDFWKFAHSPPGRNDKNPAPADWLDFLSLGMGPSTVRSPWNRPREDDFKLHSTYWKQNTKHSFHGDNKSCLFLQYWVWKLVKNMKNYENKIKIHDVSWMKCTLKFKTHLLNKI